MPEHMVIGQSFNTLFTIVDPEIARQQSLADNQPIPKAVNTVSTSSSQEPLENVKQVETVNSDWRNIIKIPEDYKEYREAFPKPIGMGILEL